MRAFVSWVAAGLMFLVIAWFAALLIFKSAFFASFIRENMASLFHRGDKPMRRNKQENPR